MPGGRRVTKEGGQKRGVLREEKRRDEKSRFGRGGQSAIKNVIPHSRLAI